MLATWNYSAMNFSGAPPNPRKTTSVRHLGMAEIARLKEAALAMPQSFWDEGDAKKPNHLDTLDKTRPIIIRIVSPNFLDWRSSKDGPLWIEPRAALEAARPED